MSQLVIGLACAKLRHRGPRVASRSIWHWLRWDVRLSMGTSISFPIARSLYFPIIRCLSSSLCFGQYLMFSCSSGLLTMRWYIVNCGFHSQTSVQRQPCPAAASLVAKRSGVYHVKSRRCSSHNPTRPATNPNANPDDMNPQSNPKRNAWYLVIAQKCPRRRDLNVAYQYTKYAVIRQYQFFMASGINRILVRALGIEKCLLQLSIVACGHLLRRRPLHGHWRSALVYIYCLLYTSDAADE